ncbi:hypothetical protein CLOM_g11514 [Closterium sp. NIES-68]|nr:hypothetical protein CLOM_g11514 [Closterium sp. NIES-68]GJP67647.1 hypothetical protein CLOP_g24439 [Closterium sp. NIES-67]
MGEIVPQDDLVERLVKSSEEIPVLVAAVLEALQLLGSKHDPESMSSELQAAADYAQTELPKLRRLVRLAMRPFEAAHHFDLPRFHDALLEIGSSHDEDAKEVCDIRAAHRRIDDAVTFKLQQQQQPLEEVDGDHLHEQTAHEQQQQQPLLADYSQPQDLLRLFHSNIRQLASTAVEVSDHYLGFAQQLAHMLQPSPGSDSPAAPLRVEAALEPLHRSLAERAGRMALVWQHMCVLQGQAERGVSHLQEAMRIAAGGARAGGEVGEEGMQQGVGEVQRGGEGRVESSLWAWLGDISWKNSMKVLVVSIPVIVVVGLYHKIRVVGFRALLQDALPCRWFAFGGQHS